MEAVCLRMTEKLQQIAGRKQVSMHQLALSRLLHRADNILLIPGTASLNHLEENIGAKGIELDANECPLANSIVQLKLVWTVAR